MVSVEDCGCLEKKLSEAFIGSVVLGLITTAPEYSFVILTLLMGEYKVSMGSTIDANIVMITLGYGLVILLATREKVAERIGRLGMDNPPIRFWVREVNSFRFTLLMILLTSILTLLTIVMGWHP